MNAPRSVLVVGGGLVGTAVARALARAGLVVTVIERGVPGAEASWAAGGILSPQAECDADGPMLRLCLRGLRDMRALAQELRDEEGLAVGWRDGGTLDVATTRGEAERLQARVRWQQDAGLTAAWLDAAAARARAPVGDDVVGGAFFAGEASLDPRLLFGSLRGSATRAGVQWITGRRVVEVGARHVALEGETRVADAVVVCAGAWTAQVRGCGVGDEAVFPVRGVIAELDASEVGGGVGRRFDAVIYGHGGYVVPRADGRVLVGSTMERAGFDKTMTAGALGRVLAQATALVPALAAAPVVSTWAGLRPGSADGLPLLGRSSTGVWIASGHFRNGVLLAAASAALLRAALVDGADIDVAFSPQRLDGRASAAAQATST